MTRRLDWDQFTSADFDVIDPMRTIAILPTAAIEQHGPHLPLGTDTMIAEGMLDLLRKNCPDDLDIRILPIQSVGKSNEHTWANGTLSLAGTTALRAWTEIGQSVARAGVRKIVIVNSHGGNSDLISILARELRVAENMLAVKCQWGAFGYPTGLFSEFELQHGLHGGDIETSLMLGFRPELVNMRRAQTFDTTARQTEIPPTGPISYGWVASDLNPHGVVGEAELATAEKGHATAQHQIAGFIDLLYKVKSASLPGIKDL